MAPIRRIHSIACCRFTGVARQLSALTLSHRVGGPLTPRRHAGVRSRTNAAQTLVAPPGAARPESPDCPPSRTSIPSIAATDRRANSPRLRIPGRRPRPMRTPPVGCDRDPSISSRREHAQYLWAVRLRRPGGGRRRHRPRPGHPRRRPVRRPQEEAEAGHGPGRRQQGRRGSDRRGPRGGETRVRLPAARAARSCSPTTW